MWQFLHVDIGILLRHFIIHFIEYFLDDPVQVGLNKWIFFYRYFRERKNILDQVFHAYTGQLYAIDKHERFSIEYILILMMQPVTEKPDFAHRFLEVMGCHECEAVKLLVRRFKPA